MRNVDVGVGFRRAVRTGLRWLIAVTAGLVCAVQPARAGADRECERAALVLLHGGWTEFERGRLADAIQTWTRSLTIARKDARVAHGLACAEARLGHVERALDWIARAIEWGDADERVLAWDPDLATVRAHERWPGLLRAASEHSRQEHASSNEPFAALDVADSLHVGRGALSPDGRWAAVPVADRTVRIVELTTGRTERVLRTNFGVPSHVAWSPDGRCVAWFSNPGPNDGAMLFVPWVHELWDVTQGRRLSVHRHGACFLAPKQEFDPSGSALLCFVDTEGARIVRVEGPSVTRDAPVPTGGAFDASWLDAGEHLLVATKDGVVRIDARDGSAHATGIHAGFTAVAFAFDPTRRRVALAGEHGRIEVWDVDTESRVWESRVQLWQDFDALSIAFAPDGATLFGSGAVDAFALAADTGHVRWVSTFEGGESFGLDVNFAGHDGLVLYDCDVRPAAVVDARDGRIVAEWSALGGASLGTVDGERLVTFGDELKMSRAADLRLSWRRHELRGGAYVLETVEGWIDASLDGLVELLRRHPVREVARRFDPKRVRAVLAGVVVSSPVQDGRSAR